MRKILAALLVLAMVLAIVPAVMAEGDEVITVTVFKGDPGNQPTEDNKIYKKIEEELGIKFEFEFLAGNLDETLGIKISDRDNLPDIFDGSNSAEMLEDAGVLIDLLPYISEEKTPNLYKHIYTDDRIKQLVDENGKLFIIPNYGINYNGEIKDYNGPAFHIQKKVIAWNNYEVPKTIDEYLDLIARYVEANPTTEDGTPYVGFAILCEGWRHFCLINPVQHLIGRPNDGEVVVDINDPNYHTETFIDKAYAKPYYKKLNEAFKKGLISRDTFAMNYDQYIAALSNGTVIGMFDQGWDFGDATASLTNAQKYENTYLALPLLYDADDVEGIALPSENWVIEEHYVNGTVMNKDRGAGISISCKFPEKMIELYETLLSDEWQKILQWGFEGEDYYVENGRMLMTKEQYQQRSDSDWQRANTANAIWTSLPKKQGHQEDGNAWSPDQQPEIKQAFMSDYDKDFLAKSGKGDWIEFFGPVTPLAPYGEAWEINKGPIQDDVDTFLRIQDEQLPGIIMAADDAEFDAKWDAFVTEVAPYGEIYGKYMNEEILKLVALVAGE